MTIPEITLTRKHIGYLAFAALVIVGLILKQREGGDPDPYDPRPEPGNVADVAHEAFVKLADGYAAVARVGARKCRDGEFADLEEYQQWFEEQSKKEKETAFKGFYTAEDNTIGETSGKSTFDADAAARFNEQAAEGFERVK